MTPAGIKEAKVRNRYLQAILVAYREYLFAQREQAQKEIMEQLIQENSARLGGVSQSFMYKGIMYYGWNCFPSRGLNRLIHPDMLAQISAAIDEEDFDVVIEENCLMNFIGQVLVAAQHMQDVYALIPERIQEPLQRVNHDAFNMGQPMSEAMISQFKQDNATGLNAFKRLFLMRLLLA